MLKRYHESGTNTAGKSALIQQFMQGIKSGHGGVLIIDPHGTLYDAIIEQCAELYLDTRKAGDSERC